MKPSVRNLRSAGLPAFFAFIAWITVLPFGRAQQKQDFAGDYAGVLGQLHVALHVAVATGGALSATVDSPDQKLFGLQCADVQINGPALSFTVPSVRGEWTGVMSPDHNSLSGVWKQNGAVAVMFTRAGSAGTAPAQTLSTTAGQPPCSAMPGAINYWDGSGWKPMVVAAHLGQDHGVSFRDGLKNPFSSRAGITNIVTFKNPAAALTLGEKPSFCTFVLPNMDPTVIMIGAIEVKKAHRELETCTGPCASRGRNSDDWMPEKRVQPVDIKRLSGNVVEITPKTPLKPGQYIIGGPPLVAYYDFGVSGPAPQQQ